MKHRWYMTNTTVADMWKRPAYESERVNQTLYGEFVRRDIKSGKYLKVFTEDSYTGWVRGDHLLEVTDYMSSLETAKIRTFTAKIFKDSRSQSPIGRLSFGSRVMLESSAKPKDGLHSRIKLKYPTGWIESEDLLLLLPEEVALSTVIRTFKMFTGVPYLWGGRSSYGVDCSGLLQLVYNFFGLELPRDSKDQKQYGESISRGKLDQGDLIFSPGHVCLYLGNGDILHATQLAGCVAIESIDPKSLRFRADIADNVQTICRVI